MSEAARGSAGGSSVELASGTHMCCMYRGPEERDDLLLPFLDAGLDAGQTCFAALNDIDPSRLRRYGDEGLPGKLILRTSDEPIFDPDTFNIESIIAFWEKTVTDELAEEGVDFVRLSAEATWWLTQVPAIDDLMRYEAMLKTFASRHPQSILCLYDIEALGASVVFSAMKLHPSIWLSGLVLDNPFYEPTP
ncbi:MAG: MEDS domain-containing protein [Propionibacteriaceae bacterium]